MGKLAARISTTRVPGASTYPVPHVIPFASRTHGSFTSTVPRYAIELKKLPVSS